MALSTYTELKTSIANWLNRTDLTSEIAEDFIVLAEKDFNSKLRIRKMNATDASFTINAETVALPTGFLQLRDMYIVEGGTKTLSNFIDSETWDEMRVFKTKEKLGDGIKGPNIKLEESKKIEIGDNELVCYENKGITFSNI